MTRFELHVQDWTDCDRCDYSRYRKKVVLGKGSLPSDILFVAEAPGDSEDTAGIPMVAQAGRLMDRILVRSNIVIPNKQGFLWEEGGTPQALWNYTVSFTNILGCFPGVKKDGTIEKDKELDYDCVMSCKPRLEEWVAFASPKIVVAIGKTAREYLDQTVRDNVRLPCPVVEIVHPASILRAPFVQRGMMVQIEVVKIRKAIIDAFHTTPLPKENSDGVPNQQAATSPRRPEGKGGTTRKGIQARRG